MRLYLTTLITLFFLLATTEVAAGSGLVIVRDRAAVSGDEVRLKDVAQISGFEEKRRQNLENVFIAKAPLPGEKAVFKRSYLSRMLTRHLARTEIRVPGKLEVERSYKRIKVEKLQGMFIDAVSKRTGFAKDRIALASFNMKDDLLIPWQESTVNIEFGEKERFRGHTTGKIVVEYQGRPYRNSFVTADIGIKSQAVLAARPIRRGEVIFAEDLIVGDIDLSGAGPGIYSDISGIVGKEAAVTFAEGALITEKKICEPLLVQRGNIVTLVASSRNLRIEAKGIAQQRGRRNETIKVLNINSNKVVYGKVTAPEEVNVAF